MTPESDFDEAFAAHGFSADPAQTAAIATLSDIYRQLCKRGAADSTLTRFKRRLPGTLGIQSPPVGAYMWGGVGRGKTFVMDVFFDALPFEDKIRYHFHRLMYRVHNQLKSLSGKADPIDIIADEIADQARVICFDEFFVSEIGDAMILGKLLQGLFRRGVCLIATSNIPPADLYRNGLQRQQFLPVIELLQKHTHVLHIDGPQDYRLRVLEQAEIWHAPLDDAAEQNLHHYFEAIAPDRGSSGQSIEILGRPIPMRRRADGIAWFDFESLCDGPRSQNDYIELARAFQTILLSDVPVMDTTQENQARRFIALVDEFYERRVKLIVSARRSIPNIYQGKRLTNEFQRTVSRLMEMQSHSYLAAPHIP
ncbi:MAG: cell division protein ZapE [Gammaproteobacteria bacterium]|nr:MAG: cell division protein ZapE [Gammaproteobacteria bacterium]